MSAGLTHGLNKKWRTPGMKPSFEIIASFDLASLICKNADAGLTLGYTNAGRLLRSLADRRKEVR